MKAYKVYNPDDHEGYQEIAFGNTKKEAKEKAWSSSEFLSDTDYENVIVERLPFLDGMHDKTQEEIIYITLLNGWWYEYEDVRYDEENIEEAIKKGIVTPISVQE